MKISIWIKDGTYNFLKELRERGLLVRLTSLEQELADDITSGTPYKEVGTMKMREEEFDIYLDSLPRQDYIVSINVRHYADEPYENINVYYQYNGDCDRYEVLDDWNEGEDDYYYVGIKALDDVTF